jgi:hypothetical protein
LTESGRPGGPDSGPAGGLPPRGPVLGRGTTSGRGRGGGRLLFPAASAEPRSGRRAPMVNTHTCTRTHTRTHTHRLPRLGAHHAGSGSAGGGTPPPPLLHIPGRRVGAHRPPRRRARNGQAETGCTCMEGTPCACTTRVVCTFFPLSSPKTFPNLSPSLLIHSASLSYKLTFPGHSQATPSYSRPENNGRDPLAGRAHRHQCCASRSWSHSSHSPPGRALLPRTSPRYSLRA